jgi:DNA mismatch repair ATPase MutS
MKAHLLFADRDFDPATPQPAQTDDLVADLGLDTVLAAMSGRDRFLPDVCRRVLFASLTDSAQIRYRQAVLADCIANPEIVRRMYGIAEEAVNRDRGEWLFGTDRPDSVLGRSIRVLGLFVGLLRRLRAIAETDEGFKSDGFHDLFASLRDELGDAYLARVEGHLKRLEPVRGYLMSARLGDGNVGTGFVLRRPHRRKLVEQILGDRSGYEFSIDARDEGGTQALAELRGRGIALAATALGRSADHILAFFSALRFELGFYVGCLNLRDRLEAAGQPTCIPEAAGDGAQLSVRDLYDPTLSLAGVSPVVGNDVDLAGKALVVITGANRGGKSTFLRALGVAQLMMQAGAFVAAESFRADIRTGVFTHYRREEDATMTRGKLDEELARAGEMVGRIRPGALVLFNESFASTNEREGSEIARQLVHALADSGVKVAYVTHMFDLAHSVYEEARPEAAFLRAERLADGTRTFRLVPGEPLPTSHGLDVFRRVFDRDVTEAPAPLATPGA